LSSTRTGFTYGGAFPVIGANPSAGIQARLNLFASGGVALDFSHTASVQLNLPPGVTFQSASGVFLNGTANVPEPAPVLMSGVGLCALWALRRCKRK